MTQETWSAVDRYLSALMIPADAGLDGALEASVSAGLPSIAVSPAQGKLLHVLARSTAPKPITGLSAFP